MFADWPLLSLVVWLPIIGGMAVLLSGDNGGSVGARRLALIVSIATFVSFVRITTFILLYLFLYIRLCFLIREQKEK